MKLHERLRGIYRAPWLMFRLLGDGRYDFVYDQMAISLRGMSWAKRANLARSGFNLLYRRARPWSMPLHMQFELVNYCNLRCPVCPTGNRDLTRPPRMMDLSIFRDVVSDAGPYLLTASLWGWGESLLHPNLADFLQETQKYKITTFLSTNGQLLDREEVIDAIVEHPPTFLIVAVDGLTDETNSHFRVGARLAPIIEGMRRLVEIKKRTGRPLPVFHMRFIVMKHNQHELPEVEAFAAANGFELLTIRALSIVDSDSARQEYGRLATDLPEFGARRSNQETASWRKRYICMQPFWFPSLFADGAVVACEQDFNAQKPMGALETGFRFRDLWTSRRACAAREQIRDASESVGFCRNCPAKQWALTDASVRAVWLSSRESKQVIIEG